MNHLLVTVKDHKGTVHFQEITETLAARKLYTHALVRGNVHSIDVAPLKAKLAFDDIAKGTVKALTNQRGMSIIFQRHEKD